MITCFIFCLISFIVFFIMCHNNAEIVILIVVVLFFFFFFHFLYYQFVVVYMLTCSHWSRICIPCTPFALGSVQPNCWWDAERQECVPCRCSPHGSISQRCDVAGRCICRPGFVGRRCDSRRKGYKRRETRRPVQRVPIEAVQQRWGGFLRTGGCPRGAYRPKAGVTHCMWRTVLCFE